MQRNFNRKNQKRGKNGPNTFKSLLPNSNNPVFFAKAFPKAMRNWTNFAEFKTLVKEALKEPKNTETNTTRSDMHWKVCAVQCRYLYKPSGGGLDRYEGHVNEVRISEGSTSNATYLTLSLENSQNFQPIRS